MKFLPFKRAALASSTPCFFRFFNNLDWTAFRGLFGIFCLAVFDQFRRGLHKRPHAADIAMTGYFLLDPQVFSTESTRRPTQALVSQILDASILRELLASDGSHRERVSAKTWRRFSQDKSVGGTRFGGDRHADRRTVGPCLWAEVDESGSTSTVFGYPTNYRPVAGPSTVFFELRPQNKQEPANFLGFLGNLDGGAFEITPAEEQ